MGLPDGGDGTVGGDRIEVVLCEVAGAVPRWVYRRASRGSWRLFDSAGVGDCAKEESGGAQENDDTFDSRACGSWVLAVVRQLLRDRTDFGASVVHLRVLR